MTKGGDYDYTPPEAAAAAQTETASRRLQERKRVTAIVGFNYLDGVLMLADTEESLGEGAKSECDKLYRFSFPGGTVIAGGAGDSHLIDCANQEMQTFFPSQAKASPTEVLEKLNEFAGKFFKTVVSPSVRFSPH